MALAMIFTDNRSIDPYVLKPCTYNIKLQFSDLVSHELKKKS